MDGKSLLIVSSIERIAPNVHTTVEIVQEKHVQNFRYNHVNEFVLSHDAVSRLAVRAALQEGNSDVLMQLLSRQHGDDIYEVALDPAWNTYGDAFWICCGKERRLSPTATTSALIASSMCRFRGTPDCMWSRTRRPISGLPASLPEIGPSIRCPWNDTGIGFSDTGIQKFEHSAQIEISSPTTPLFITAGVFVR